MIPDWKSSKGQVFTPDFAASIAIFSIFLLFFGLIWNAAMKEFAPQSEMVETQNRYTFNLMKTSGHPKDWNRSNVEVPGLYEEGKLSADKFVEFREAKVQRRRRVLRTQHFQIEVRDVNDSIVEYNASHISGEKDLEMYSSSTIPASKSVYTSHGFTVLKETGERVELRYTSWDE
jgi:hypothetical protein